MQLENEKPEPSALRPKRKTIVQLPLVVLLLALALGGCISRRTQVPMDQRLLPAATKTRTELMEDLKARSGAISTLIAKVQLDVSGGGGKTGVLTEYRKSSGIIQVG